MVTANMMIDVRGTSGEANDEIIAAHRRTNEQHRFPLGSRAFGCVIVA
jgi:hypothetical protein